MFPFDEQVFFPPFPLQMMFSMCFMMFGSWTYHGQALDLQIDADNTTAGKIFEENNHSYAASTNLQPFSVFGQLTDWAPPHP